MIMLIKNDITQFLFSIFDLLILLIKAVAAL